MEAVAALVAEAHMVATAATRAVSPVVVARVAVVAAEVVAVVAEAVAEAVEAVAVAGSWVEQMVLHLHQEWCRSTKEAMEVEERVVGAEVGAEREAGTEAATELEMLARGLWVVWAVGTVEAVEEWAGRAGEWVEEAGAEAVEVVSEVGALEGVEATLERGA